MGVFLDYLTIWSLLHHPVGVVPVTSVQDDEQAGYEDGFNDNWTKIVREDIKNSVGMPLSVSIVAPQWQDEIIVGVMQALEEKVQFKLEPKNL